MDDDVEILSVRKLVALYGGILWTPHWSSGGDVWRAGRVTLDMCREFLVDGRTARPSRALRDNFGTVEQHAMRIAWIAAHWDPAGHPIDVDFGVEPLSVYDSWRSVPIQDGHHRLAAAVVLRFPWIAARCSGLESTIRAFRYRGRRGP